MTPPPTTRRRRRYERRSWKRLSDAEWLLSKGWIRSTHFDGWSRDGVTFYQTAMALRMARKAEEEQRVREASE